MIILKFLPEREVGKLKECVIAMILCFFFVFLAVPRGYAFVCEDYSDCKALVEFKKGISSDPEGHLQAWNEANPLCNWTGVTCHEYLKHRVVALELTSMKLQGSLSPFLSNLSLLVNLSLHTNRFHGEFPSTFGELRDLVLVNLSYNYLRGEIPASIQGCQSLKFMDLTRNNLSGVIPKGIGIMKSLSYLSLSSNRLTGNIPSFLSNLTELKHLELSENFFTGKIPSELEKLKKLEILYVHLNNLKGPIPAAISNCTALLEISLGLNWINGEIPSELGFGLQNLKKFYAMKNELSGRIPVTLSNLSRLTLLDLSMNKLVGGVPMEFGMLKNLEILYVHSNLLDNSSLKFLTALTNCSHLKKLHLASCFFTGKLPDSLGDLSKELYYINLLNNRITGNIPESIGNLSGLVNLNLWYNFLNGKVPASVGKLGKLQELNLGRNTITGPIPDDVGKMDNLGLLDLSNNLINGSIPKSLCNSPMLRYLDLSINRLSGNFPIEITKCSILLSLDLSYNQLQGYVPLEIGRFSDLAFSLNLSSNKFEGNVPETIGKLISVQEIDLSKNNFSGMIPNSVGSCVALRYLNFSNNMLQGPIPESLNLISDLEVIDFSQNQLNGTIPAWIGSQKTVHTLNLSFNRFSGELPNTGNFTRFHRSSFIGNSGLCGGSSKLHLAPCENQHGKHNNKNRIPFYVISAVIFSFILFMIIVSIIWFFFSRKKYKKEQASILGELPNIPGQRVFTQREIEVATSNFDETNLLGRGRFGSVYKASLDEGRITVAVKVFHEESVMSHKSLKREFKILSEIQHRNLVRMIGSAWNRQFKALVLEFIPNGNLDQHLYPNGSEEETCELTMKERLSIAIDIANGLEYLQEGCPTRVVHCDVKPKNVLLDEDLVARIADFGIGKLFLERPNDMSSTASGLRGSIGYIPPEYSQGREVSGKGDTYSFGVVLLEMVTRKRPTSAMFCDGLDMRKWVISCFPSNVLEVVDLALKRQASLGGSVGDVVSLEKCCIEVIKVGLDCTQNNPHDRPLMSSVLAVLFRIWRDMSF